MSELLALSHLLEKPESELTPIERAIIVASAADEDLANSAAEEFAEMRSKIEQNFNGREQFFLKLCRAIGLMYEDAAEEDIFREIRNLKNDREKWMRSYSL